MTNKSEVTAKEVTNYFHWLNIIFYSLLGSSMVGFVLLYLNLKKEEVLRNTFDVQTSDSLMILMPLACLLAIPLSYFFYVVTVKKGRQLAELNKKLQAFRQASITQYLVLFIGGAIAILMLYMTFEAVFAVTYCIVFFVFTLNRPTPEKIAKAMKLKKEEFAFLNENRV